jgi:hypothetical protein
MLTDISTENGSQGSAHEFTSEELDIIRMVITEWRKVSVDAVLI